MAQARRRGGRVGRNYALAKVPENIIHPVMGLDNSVAEVTTSVSRKLRTVR
jgi:hypothetical protein